MERVVRFELELTGDKPEYRIGDSGTAYTSFASSATDIATQEVIVFEGAKLWSLRRYLVAELSEYSFKFIIEDRGALPTVGSNVQEMCIQRACLDRGIYTNHLKVTGPLPEGVNPTELFFKIRMLETASKDLATQVMYSLFWELEAEPSYFAPKESWLYPYAKNHLQHLHDSIRARYHQDVKKVMES